MLQGEEGKEKIVVPLSGLPIAPYYGCLLTRPGGGIDSPQNPQVLERLIRLLSAKPVSYPCETLCCGGPIFMPQDKAASTTAFQILKKASDAGARAIVTACPLCQLMLDVKQRSLETKAGEKIGLPVLYVTQLAGIALGLGPDELGLGLNSVSPMSLLEEIYKRMAELCRENGK
jgi:heterodisulfide reductase subunit B